MIMMILFIMAINHEESAWREDTQLDEPSMDAPDDIAGKSRYVANVFSELEVLGSLMKRSAQRELISIEKLAQSVWEELEPVDTATLDVQTSRELLVDSEWIQYALTAAFQNALEYAGPKVTVSIEIRNGTLVIADDGPGMDPSLGKRVLQSGVSTVDHRPGLGLSIIEHVADAHRWTFGIETTDSGTRIELNMNGGAQA